MDEARGPTKTGPATGAGAYAGLRLGGVAYMASATWSAVTASSYAYERG